MWHKERSLWVPERKLYYGFPVPGVVASVGGGGTTLSEGSTGLVIASSGASVSDGSGIAWSNPSNITVDDNTRATCFRTSNGTSHLLYATFDLSAVPDGATITGVIVRISKDYSTSTPPKQIRDNTVRLTKDGTNLVGDNKADTATDWIQNVLTDVDYGGADDLWGTTLTAAEVKAATFGVMLEAVFTVTANANARVDFIKMNVHYLS